MAALIPMVACSESESTPTGPTPSTAPAINEIVTAGPINAASSDALVYFSLAENMVVAESDNWELAFRRFEVRLNSGVSGTGSITGYSIGNNTTATDEEILSFTSANTLAAFDAVRAADIPDDSLFGSDRLVENSTGYLSFGGAPRANGTAYWKVRTASGGHALMRVTEITLSPMFALTGVSFEVREQLDGTLGAPQAFSVSVAGAAVAVALSGGAAVTPSGCNWDVQINPQGFGLSANTDCNVGTFPGPTAPTFAASVSASDAPEYAPYLAGLTGPIANSITAPDAPFRYNLAGDNRLSPSFNTYLVRSGARVYKVQFSGYYSASGASGHPSLRYARIR